MIRTLGHPLRLPPAPGIDQHPDANAKFTPPRVLPLHEELSGEQGRPLLLGLCIFCLVASNLVSYTRARAEGLGLRADSIVASESPGWSHAGVAFVAASAKGRG